MAKTGDTLTLPGGTTCLIVKSPAETAGERVELEFSYPPGAPAVPPHFHPNQEEEQKVLSGTLSVYLEGDWRSLGEGESVSIARGRVHGLRNRSSETVRFRDVHVPALEFQDYVKELHRLSQAGKITTLRSPSTLIYLSMVWREHRGTQLPASAALRAAVASLAVIGRLLGYRTT